MDFLIKDGIVVTTELLGGVTSSIAFKIDSLDSYRESGIDNTIVNVGNYTTTIPISFPIFNNAIRAVIRQKK